MKRTNKKMLSAILAALLLAGFCTGCGSTPPASDGADNGAEDTGTAAGSGEIALLPMTDRKSVV